MGKKILLKIVCWGFPEKMGGAERELIDIALNIDKEIFDVIVYGYYPQNNKALEIMFRNAGVEYINGVRIPEVKKKLEENVDGDIVIQFGKDHDKKSFIKKNIKINQLCLYIDMCASLRNIVDKEYDVVYCVCEYLMEHVEDNMGWRSKSMPMFSWHYGDMQRKTRGYSDLILKKLESYTKGNKGNTIFGYVGRLEKFKNVEYIIEAFSRIDKEANAFLRIIGDGKERENLQNLAREKNMGAKILFYGWDQDILKRLYDMDVFVMASRSEGLPRAMNEAMMMALPVITTRAGGIPELCGRSYGVRYIDFSFIKDNIIQHLYEDMEYLTRYPNLIPGMGYANLERAINYNSHHTIKVFENTIMDLRSKYLACLP